MKNFSDFWLAIFLMTAVTFLPRLLPVLFLSQRRLAPAVRVWLSYVPAAVLAALLGPILLLPQGSFNLKPPVNPYFWAAIPSLWTALKTRNMFLTVLVGIAALACLRLVI